MRVLHLISSGGMYGAEAVILQLCREMSASAGHSSHLGVFALAGQPEPALYGAAVKAGVDVEQIPCKGQLDLGVSRRLQALVERTGADVIHAHGYKADVYAFLAFRGAERPALVSTCHTWYDNDLAVRLYGALDRRVLRSFDRVVAVSDEVSTRLLRAGVKRERVRLVRNGVPVPPLVAMEAKAALRVGLVGRLAPEKGVDVFLRAVARLVEAQPSTEFVVAGEGPDRLALEALHRELALPARVSLPGQQSGMAQFYRSLDLLVSASRQEGLPMAMLEGMAAGLPVVATSVGEVPRVVVPEETGLLVPPDNPHALAEAMQRLLANAALRARFGQTGRQRVLDHFSAARMTADYLEIYTEALQQHPAPQRKTLAAGAAQ